MDDDRVLAAAWRRLVLDGRRRVLASIHGALRTAIYAHGPITVATSGSAEKRVRGAMDGLAKEALKFARKGIKQ